MAERPEQKYRKFEQALKYFNSEQIAALYSELGRHECKFHTFWYDEWPLEFCIRKEYIKSAQCLINLGLPLEELNCGLEKALTKKPGTNYTELVKTLLKAGTSISSSRWLDDLSLHYKYKPEHISEVLRSLCAIPTDPTSRYLILGIFLHYCCMGSYKCHLAHPYDERDCYMNEECKARPDKSLFNMTWYKTMEYLLSEGLHPLSYNDKSVREATFCFITPHVDISVMSIMLRLSTGSTFSKNMFAEYVAHNSRTNDLRSCAYNNEKRDLASHEQDLLDLLPMFYHVGVDVCDTALVFEGPGSEQYRSFCAYAKTQPRTLRDMACLRVRHTLPGPNVMCSVRALTGVPIGIRKILMLKNLDITHSLEPECIVWYWIWLLSPIPIWKTWLEGHSRVRPRFLSLQRVFDGFPMDK